MKHLIYISILSVYMMFSCREPEVPIYSSDKSDIEVHNLISPLEAKSLLDTHQEQYIVVEVSKTHIYNQGHIPRALNIWRPDYASEKTQPISGLIPSRERLEKLLQTLGYEEGKTFLLYDAKANVDALRFAWVLELYGFNNYKIINGGKTYWLENNLALDTMSTLNTAASDYTLEPYFNNDIIAYFEDVRNAIKDTNTILIDTREEYEYLGEPFIQNQTVHKFKKGAYDNGSIPTAIHLNWSKLADLSGDHRIKSEKDLRYDLEQFKISPDKNIILYCHSGSRTSHSFYVLKHVLGFPNVRNYDGSWIEWSHEYWRNPELPVQKLISESEQQIMIDSLNSILVTNE